MRVLITGASGFVGATLSRQLELVGHEVVPVVRDAKKNSGIGVNFANATNAKYWQTYIEQADAVVNTVGLLGGAKTLMDKVHIKAPQALAEAASIKGIKHFVHISALGVFNSEVDTRYFSVREQGEDAILQAFPQATIFRPSIIFGKNGDSSKMFMNLRRLPFAMLPQSGLVQPVHVLDLCQAIINVLAQSSSSAQVINAVGPFALPLPEYIASLAQQLGSRPPHIFKMPKWLAHSSAYLMSFLNQHVWTPETLAMLCLDSTADPRPFREKVGAALTTVENFIEREN